MALCYVLWIVLFAGTSTCSAGIIGNQQNSWKDPKEIFYKQEGIVQYVAKSTPDIAVWYIEPANGAYITISFTYINILPLKENRHGFTWLNECRNYLEATTNLDTGKSHRWCGTSLPPPITFYGNRVYIRLYVRETVSTPPSFHLHYHADEQCAFNYKIQSYAFITSVGYPDPYPKNTLCAWNVSLDADSSHLPLQLILTDCQLGEESTLYIYDGQNDSADLLWSASYYSCYHLTIKSSGPHMYIKFVSGPNSYSGFNATVKAEGYCLPGYYSCGDTGTCYSEEKRCDSRRDCENGYDEMGCEDCASDQFWCGDKKRDCYTAEQYCDGKPDCMSGSTDENQCTKCSAGAFQCRTSKKCIYEMWKCDGQSDCSDQSDEEDCSYTASRQVITAAIVGSLVCGLLLAVALGCSCKLYTLRMAARQRRRRNVVPTPLGRIARELLRREAPPSYSMAIDGVDSDSPESSLRRSSSRQRRRSNRERRRRRHRNRDPPIRRAAPSSSSQSSAAQTSTQTNNNRGDNIISEPSREASSTSETTAPAEEATSSNAQAQSGGASGPEAAPLPKKRRIQPVMVEAPCSTELVEDIANCVYPNPPTYSEVVQVDDPVPLADLVDPGNGDTAEHPDSSKKTISRLLPRYSRRRTGFWRWRSIFRRSTASHPFHELEEEPDPDDAPTSVTVAADTPSTSSSGGDPAQNKVIVRLPPTTSNASAITNNRADDFSDDDDDDLLLFTSPGGADPVELRVLCGDAGGSSSADVSWS